MEHGFPGDFYAKNLTPNNLGDWTDGEVYRAITPGENNTSMPWRLYSKVNEEDLRTIYAYLQTLAPISNTMERFVAVND